MAPPIRRLLLPHLTLVLALVVGVVGGGSAEVPALYVFGDSTADVGNNNYLADSRAKADFPHNGIDFPANRPTGRFSNGYNGIDFLATHMGFRRSPPAFLSLASKTIQQIMKGKKGVNFASGGSGILDSTGSAITMRNQISHFATIQTNMTARMTTEKTSIWLSKSLFIISSGGNDIFAYFRNGSLDDSEKEKFVATLISNYKNHILKLYNLGARKFGIVNVPPIGCCPYPRSLNPTGACMDSLNELALRFNEASKDLLQSLSSTHAGMKYSIGNSYAVVQNIIRNPTALGFKEVKTACCGSGKFNGESGCAPNTTYCTNRHQYLFWDPVHPTHATSKLAGMAFYRGSQEFASPINFKQLSEDDEHKIVADAV